MDMSDDADHFYCPISNALMADPVLADDNRTYERECIEAWFSTCRTRGLPITSPWTREPMGTSLRENAALRSAIETAVHEKVFGDDTRGVSSVLELQGIFAHLDSLRALLEECLADWQTPQIVVVGSESSGKSSLLERLVMMPMLPTDEGICTRLPIHVRLRNAAKGKAPRLEVFNTITKTTEEGPWVISQLTRLEIQDKMKEIITKEHKEQKGVSTERIIILYVEGPQVPSIDLVDMPGLRISPPQQKAATRKIVEDHVERHGAYSFYLAVVPATERPCASLAIELIEAKKLEDRTFGVFTKCDELSSAKLQSLSTLVGRPPAEHLGAVGLEPHGWYATMNRPLPGLERGGFGRLRRQAEEELKFFQEHAPGLVESGQASCGGLVKGLSRVFLHYVRTTWGPTTLRKLAEALEEVKVDIALLGLPVLDESMTHGAAAPLREAAAKAATSALEAGWPTLSRECCAEVLEPLKARLMGLVKEEMTGVRVEDVARAWGGQEQSVVAACVEAAEQWEAFWVHNVRAILEAKVKRPADHQGRLRMLAAPPVQLGRFPAYVEALLGRLGRAAARDKAAIVDAVRRGARQFHEAISPWTHWETRLSGKTPTASVRCDRKDLVEGVVVAFLTLGRGPMEVAEEAEAAAAEVGVEGWVEVCGEERRELLGRMGRVEKASEGLLAALGAKSADELTDQGGGNHRDCSRLRKRNRELGDSDEEPGTGRYRPFFSAAAAAAARPRPPPPPAMRRMGIPQIYEAIVTARQPATSARAPGDASTRTRPESRPAAATVPRRFSASIVPTLKAQGGVRSSAPPTTQGAGPRPLPSAGAGSIRHPQGARPCPLPSAGPGAGSTRHVLPPPRRGGSA